jgi:N-acetylglucosaminyldiphosphoundecaprenol N-acetyl-beta-D-mannosaminyltransferase
MATEAATFTGSPWSQLTVEAPPVENLELERARVDIGGVLVDRIDLGEARARLREFVESGTPHHVVTVNLDFVRIAQDHEEFRTLVNTADMAVADGMPLVWLSRVRGIPLPERIAGIDLVAESCMLAAEQERSVYLLGAAEGIADAAATRMQAQFPGIRIAGTYSPPVGGQSEEDNRGMVQRVAEAAPDFLFVALGAPRQDLWIRQHMAELHVPVAIGVGCTLDVMCGAVQRAPTWMQSTGLEWSFRLLQEPQRLWRRYLMHDLPLLARLMCERPNSAAELAAPVSP